MMIRVKINERLPLKRQKKIICKGGKGSIVVLNMKGSQIPVLFVVYLDIWNSFVLNLQFCLKIRFEKNGVPS